MTIQQIQYIIALDKERHFVRAAERACVTQPTLTMQVKKLEEELGFEIFNRQKKPIEPTSSGKKVLTHAYAIQGELDALKNELNTDKEELTGSFSLGIIPTLAPYLLPLFLNAFRIKYPKIELNIIELQSDWLINDILTEKIDLGLIVTPLQQKGIVEHPLFYEPFWFYANQEHQLLKHDKLKTNDLAGHPFWVLDQGHCFRNQVLNICGEPSGISGVHYQSGSIETIKRLVDNSDSYTLVPELAIDLKKEKKQIRPFVDPMPVREVSLAYSRSFSKTALIQAMHESIIAHLPGRLKKVESKKRIPWR